MTGGDSVEAQRQGSVQHSPKLDVLVASHAWIRCPIGLVFGEEVIHYFLGEFGREIPDIEGNAECVCNSARISCIVESATAARLSPGGLRPGQRKVYSDHVMALIHHSRRSDRRIHAARERSDDSHRSTSFSRAAR